MDKPLPCGWCQHPPGVIQARWEYYCQNEQCLSYQEHHRYMGPWNQRQRLILVGRRADFLAGRERVPHPDWDWIYDNFEDYLKAKP